MNIIFVGFMGCGKTTISKLLSEKLGCRLIDSDDKIEKDSKMTIPEIFAESSEAGFREMEHELLVSLFDANLNSTIISTGGGIVEREDNRKLLKNIGKVVYLRCSFAKAWERIEGSERPLAQDYDKCKALFERREALYEEIADMVIDADVTSPYEAVSMITKEIK